MEEFKSFYKKVDGNEGNKCKYPTRLDTYGCGCSHDCKYCYAKSLLSFRKLWKPESPKVADLHKIVKVISKIPKPWEDVAVSVKRQKTNPIIIDHKCDKCGNNTVAVYFVSPAWTWEKLCGRAGYLIICPHCVRQMEYFCSYMN